ncbi:MAG TPA: hypothetical protein VF025_14820 [Gaiellaceae bacterium]
MPTDTLSKEELTVLERAPAVEPEDELHERARKRVERIHGVKANVAAFLVGMIVLVPVWLLVEWQSAGGFERWSEGGNPGDWDAWILYIVVPWFMWVAFVCLRAYIDRDKEGEIEREVRRLRASG